MDRGGAGEGSAKEQSIVKGIKMGKVVGKIRVTNFRDTSKSVEIEAVIDTGATMSVLPVDLIQEPGFDYRARKVIPTQGLPRLLFEIFMAASPNKRVSGYATFGCSDQNHALSEMADKRRG